MGATEDNKAKADQLKNEGNEALKNVKYDLAIEKYSDALELDKTAVLYSNRAAVYVKRELPGAALADAEEAIQLDPNYTKALYRKASAHILLGRLKEARTDLEAVLAKEPGNTDAKNKLETVRGELRKIAFAAAIASEDSEPMVSRLKWEEIPVPPSYSGPKLGDDRVINADFVVKMMEQFRDQKLICKRDVVQILKTAYGIFKETPNIVKVNVPDEGEITVCGDTHGQFYDLLNIFKMNGNPSETNPYVFNGDFVDRGSYSFEVVTTLLAWKCVYPNNFYLSRGNHESHAMTSVYGFQGEVKSKFDEKIVALYKEVFNALNTGHVLNNKVYVVHGGLYSNDDVTIDAIQKLNRFTEIPESGPLCESLWSDPQPMMGRGISKRGVGCSFGPDVTDRFLKKNNLELVVRSHEVKDEGYVVEHGGKCITVFSAPNYCDQIGNKGAFIRFNGKEMKPKFTTYAHVQHPGKRPMQYSSAFAGMM